MYICRMTPILTHHVHTNPHLEGHVGVVGDLAEASEQLLPGAPCGGAGLEHHTRPDGDGDNACVHRERDAAQ